MLNIVEHVFLACIRMFVSTNQLTSNHLKLVGRFVHKVKPSCTCLAIAALLHFLINAIFQYRPIPGTFVVVYVSFDY